MSPAMLSYPGGEKDIIWDRIREDADVLDAASLPSGSAVAMRGETATSKNFQRHQVLLADTKLLEVGFQHLFNIRRSHLVLRILKPLATGAAGAMAGAGAGAEVETEGTGTSRRALQHGRPVLPCVGAAVVPRILIADMLESAHSYIDYISPLFEAVAVAKATLLMHVAEEEIQ
ncbi:hypothetical protein C8Q74DRAFT_1374130 [Fomes fomentarius]|nr:hypothetical protein C8Q74DRAFT_1374130 [Fomes fomentarius]